MIHENFPPTPPALEDELADDQDPWSIKHLATPEDRERAIRGLNGYTRETLYPLGRALPSEWRPAALFPELDPEWTQDLMSRFEAPIPDIDEDVGRYVRAVAVQGYRDGLEVQRARYDLDGLANLDGRPDVLTARGIQGGDNMSKTTPQMLLNELVASHRSPVELARRTNLFALESDKTQSEVTSIIKEAINSFAGGMVFDESRQGIRYKVRQPSIQFDSEMAQVMMAGSRLVGKAAEKRMREIANHVAPNFWVVEKVVDLGQIKLYGKEEAVDVRMRTSYGILPGASGNSDLMSYRRQAIDDRLRGYTTEEMTSFLSRGNRDAVMPMASSVYAFITESNEQFDWSQQRPRAEQQSMKHSKIARVVGGVAHALTDLTTNKNQR